METKNLSLFNWMNRRGSGANLNLFRSVAMVLVLLSLGITNAWAWDTNYYAKVTAKVSNTGGGKVYASKSNATPAANNYSETSSSAQNSATNTGVTLYIFATAKDGYAFKGWSKTENKYDLGTNSPYTVNSGTSGISTSSGNYTEVGPYYATFVKIFQFKAKADFATGSAGLGDVCVNFTNGTPAYQASAMTATATQNGDDANTASKTKTAYLFAQSHIGAEFRGWYRDAACTNKVSDNANYSESITSSVIAEPSTPQLTLYAKFEKVETTPHWALPGIAGTSKTLEIGEEITLETNTAGTSYSWGTPTYVDAGETNPVMTYDPSTKKFTANRAGTVTVTFTQAAGEVDGVLWKDGSQTFTFTVNKCTPTFAWANPLPNFVVGTNLPVSDLFSFTPAESAQSWTLTSSDPTNLPSIAAPATQLSLPKEVNGVTLTFHQDATWKWNEIANTSITVNVTKEPVVFNWKNPALIAGNTYSWTDFVETNSAGAWNLMSENESIIPTMRSIASTSGTVAAGVVTLTFTQGPDLGHDAVPLQTKTFTVYSGLARFKIGTSGSNYTNDLAYALSEASKLSSNKYVFVAEDGIVIPGTYNVPSGVTLVVPYESSFQTSYITKPKEVANSTLPIEAYRTLKLVDGVTINVNSGGAISVCAQIQSGDASHNPTGFPVGPVGVIDMSTGGKINVKSNGTLYAWGFIKGEGYLDGNNTTHVGSVTAESGSTVWECFGMGDWNGGSFTVAAGDNSKSYRIFPFQSYYVQNIEVPLHIKYGAQEKLFASFYANSSTNNTSITFMSYGSNTAMFLVTENSSTSEVVKRYDPATDHMVVDLVGKSKLGSLDITISYSFISVTASSKDFDCPIVNNMHIRLIDCDLSLTTPIKMFPGSVFEVTQGSRLLISTNVYVMDHDDWGKVVNKHYFGVTPKTLSPHASLGDDIDDNTLPDAKIIVDGGVEISSGGIFTSPAGANVMGNGGGTFRWTGSLPGNATTNGYTLGSSVDGSTFSSTLKPSGILATVCNPAKLHNDAETANDTYTASVGSKTFYNIHGRWFVQEDKDEKSDHTYKFTYIDGSNTGATAYCIYTADKTGLMAGYKWVNVELDDNFCGGKTYRGEDGNYYCYNSASTDAVSKWVQFVKLNDVLYSGSDNKLYTFTGCAWTPSDDIDENCMYTIDGVKKALVGTEFVALEKDEYDEVYVNVANHSDYYMLFSGCVWQHATKIPDTYKAYEVLGDPYIWLNDEWTKVEEESPYYYITDDQTIKHYYEFDYVTFTWQPVKNKVRITSSTEGSRDFLTWDDAMLYLGQYTNPTVTLLEDAIATQSVATLAPNSKSTAFTFDLNGHTLSANIGSAAYAIPSTDHACFMNMNTSAKLYITDNSDKGTGQILVYGVGNKNISCLRVTKGNVVMNGGRIYMENGFKYVNNNNYKKVRAAGISLAAGQTLEINGGEIEAKTHIYAYGVFAESSAATATTSKITMNGGKVTGIAATYPYGILSYGIINMNGGVVEAKTEKVTTAVGTTNAGSNAYGLYGNITASATDASSYFATINMTGGTVNATAHTATAYGVFGSSTYTTANGKKSDGTSDNSYKSTDGTYSNKASCKLNITGGEVNAVAKTSTGAYGIYSAGTYNSYKDYNTSTKKITITPHVIKDVKVFAQATGTAYGILMSAQAHEYSGGTLWGEAVIDNADVYAETTVSTDARAVSANATNIWTNRARYSQVSASNKKTWYVKANNNDGDVTHEGISATSTQVYQYQIGCHVAAAKITINSGTYRAKSANSTTAYGVYCARSVCPGDPTGNTAGVAEVTINGGTFSAETMTDTGYGIGNYGITTVNGGTFNVRTGTTTAYGVCGFAGTLTLNSGVIINSTADVTTAYGVAANGWIDGNTGMHAHGNVIVNEGVTVNVTTPNSSTAYGAYALATNAELNQTKYNARSASNKTQYYAVNEEGTTTTNATTANYYPYRFGTYVEGGEITINGGTFNVNAFTTKAIGALADMSSVVRTDMIGRVDVARGKITIHDGEFNVEAETSSTAEGIRSYGIVNVDGGTFNIKSKTTTAYGLYVMDGTTTIDDGTFNIYAGTNTAVGLRSHVYENNSYGYYVGGEAIINGGTFNVNTWSGNTAYGVYVTGAAAAFSATSATGYTGEKPSNYAVAGRATVNGGTFVMNPSTGVDAYGFVLEPNKVSGTATAYPKCEVTGGFFQMKGTGVYAANASATEDAEGNPNLWVKGGHFSTKTNLEQASPKNYVRAPHHVLNCVHPEYKATYPYEVAEAYTITFKDDEDNTLWSGLQPKGSTAVYPLTNGTPEKTATATNSFEFTSWNTPLATVTADATYIASFNTVAKKFMVTWKDDAGNEIDHMEYASGATPTHADPVKEGYTFTGWTPGITAVAAADQIYTATFTINQYTIRWENEDGSLIREDQVNYGVKPTAPSNPTKEGYSFSAWNPGVVNATENVTYTATYLLNIASVTTSANKTTNYTAWSSALTAANGAANSTLTLLTDVGGLGSQAIKQTFTLELNGHTLSGTANKLLDLQTAGKTLTIRDSQGGGKIATKYATKGQLVAVYVTKGTLNIEGGHILAENTNTTETTSYYACGVLVSSGYVCNMSGGTVEGITNIDLAYGLYNNGGTVTITGGTIKAQAQTKAHAVHVKGNTTVTDEHEVVINATTTRTTIADAFYVTAAGKTLTINGGVFTATTGTTDGYAINATAAATINVNGGKFKSTTKTVSNTGSATIHLNAGFYDTDTELAGFASPKQVVALTTEPEKVEGYNYKIVDNAHQVTFKNEDGSVVLQQSYIEDGIQPVYSGEAQTKAPTPKYAYDFDGWKDASDDHVYAEAELPVVSEDVVYTAHFVQRAVEYPITFANIDGMGTDYVQMVAYDEVPVYNGPTPYMSGAVSNYAYTFIGWDPTPVAVNGPATYTPRYDLVISHNVSFVINNPSAVTPTTLTVAEGAAVERPADQLIGCQHIAGWYKDAGLNEEWDFANDKMGDHDIILYAKWETKTYTITWLDENADEIDQTIVDCGVVPSHADLYKPSTAACSYEWRGWNKTLVAANADAAYKSLGFTQVPKRYAITFVTGSGATVINPIEQEVGSAITPPADPTREGYTFNGWIPEVPGTMPAKDVTCVAQWTPVNYTITYNNLNGATNSNPATYTIETATITLVNPGTRAGYDFTGWTCGGNPITQIALGSTGDKTITANWSAVTYNLTYEGLNGATNSNPATYTIETATITLANPGMRVGYTFTGWTCGGSPITQITLGSTGDKTITANWSAVTYNLTYEGLNGASNSNPATYTVETETFALADPGTRSGYTFTGWTCGGDPITQITLGSTGDKTITANWSAVSYNLTYEGLEGASNSNPATYTIETATITLVAPGTREGYAFTGWTCGGDPITQITLGSTGDKTITANWSVVTYSLTYEGLNGATNSNPSTYTIETATITLVAPGTREGYAFTGWTCGGDPITQITLGSTGDKTITANWTPAVASVTVSGATTYYATLQAAFNYAADKTTPTITMLSDVSGSSKLTYTNSSTTTVTFDLNGHTISGAGNPLLYITAGSNAGTFVIKSSVAGGQIRNTLSSTAARFCVQNYQGTLKLESGTIYNENTNTGASYAVYARRAFTMTNGTLEAKGQKDARTLFSLNTTKISGGSLSATATGSSGYATGIYIYTGTTTVSGEAQVTANAQKYAYGVRVYGTKPALNSAKTSVSTYNGVLNVEGGTFDITATTSNAYGVYCYRDTMGVHYATSATLAGNYVSAGTANIKGGTFNVTSNGTTAYGVVVQKALSVQRAKDADGVTTTYAKKTATPKAIITGGLFNVKTVGDANATAYAMNSSAANTALVVQAGYYTTNKTDASSNPTIEGKYTQPTKTSVNYWVLPMTGEDPYMYKVAEAYQITFNNEDGRQLQQSYQEKNTMAAYSGEEPTKAEDDDYTYTFDGWDPALATVTEEATYTAQYTSVSKETGSYLDIVGATATTLIINANPLTLSKWPYTINGTSYGRDGKPGPDYQCNADRTITFTHDKAADEQLTITVKDKTDDVVSRRKYTIPHVYESNDATLDGTDENSIVFVNSGTLKVSGTKSAKAIYVGADAELKVTGTLNVTKLVLRTTPWTAAVLTNNGTINATNTYYSRVVADNSQFYQFGLPCSSTTTGVIMSDGSTPSASSWQLKEYSEYNRAKNGVSESGENWVALSSTTIAGGKGYEIYSGSKYYREYCFPITIAEGDAVPVQRTGDDKTNSGWNIIVSPKMGKFIGEPKPEDITITVLQQDGGYVQEIPEVIMPAVPFSYQASAPGMLNFGSTLLFNASAPAPRRKAVAEETERIQWIHLDIADANGSGDQTSIYSHPTRYDQVYQTGIDVAKQSLTASRAIIYSSHAYGEMAFAGVADSLLEQGVALTVYSPCAQALTFSMRGNDWLNRMKYIWLVDHETGARTDLLWDTYTFEATEGTVRGRFTIEGVFRTPQITTDVESMSDERFEKDGARKVLLEQKMFIQVGERLYDATGKLVKRK